jgi:hypothetical protein
MNPYDCTCVAMQHLGAQQQTAKRAPLVCSRFSGQYGLLIFDTGCSSATDHGKLTSDRCITFVLPWIEVWEVRSWNDEIRRHEQNWRTNHGSDWATNEVLIAKAGEIYRFLRDR